MNHVMEFKDISGQDWVHVTATGNCMVSYPIGSETDEEVAADYRKREDERLGRESFEVDGELFYVFVDETRLTPITVSNAATGDNFYSYGTQPIDHSYKPIYKAYNMWVEAHNPPKEPQEGEIWDIEMSNTAPWRCVVRDGWFVPVNPNCAPPYALDDQGIVRKEFVL